MVAASLCRFLEWDSAFFGVRIGRINVNHLTSTEMAAALAWASACRLQGLYFLCAPDDDTSVRLAEAHGFHLVDVRMTLAWRRADADDVAVLEDATRLARPYRPEDRTALERIAETAYRDTRFYYDSHFATAQADALYREWIRKSCDGAADAVLVVAGEGGVSGFITCHLEAPHRGRIGLVGVRRDTRGTGVGQLLVKAALAYFVRHGIGEVEVATQGRNLAAQRLYQKYDFRTQALHLWYHKWFEEGVR
jgi:ribosomal protein S18 acetylase RimI-like enzyme